MIESTTPVLISLALDAAVMRQQAIANNIANVNTPGYRRFEVDFEGQLDAMRSRLDQGHSLSLADLAQVRPVLMQQDEVQEVSLDTEVAELAQTALYHQALLKALNKHFAVLNVAINEGKR